MKAFLFLMIASLLSCTLADGEIHMGKDFYYSTTDRIDLQMLYIKKGEYIDHQGIKRPLFKRFIRGKIDILFNNEDLMIGYIDADNSGFEEELRSPHDKTGYFIINKRSRNGSFAVMSIGTVFASVTPMVLGRTIGDASGFGVSTDLFSAYGAKGVGKVINWSVEECCE